MSAHQIAGLLGLIVVCGGTAVQAEQTLPNSPAIKQGDEALAEIRAWIQSGADVDAADEERRTLLQLASEAGHVEAVRVLLAAGADGDAYDDSGETPLFAASWMFESEIIRLLLAAGANVNVVNRAWHTPLWFAVLNNDPELVKLLLIAGACVNLTDKDDAPLYIASQHGAAEIVKLLLEAGANPNIIMCLGSCDGGVLSGLTALSAALDHHEIVKLLIDAGANVNAADSWGITPLSKAFRAGLIKTVKLLEEAGAKVHPEIQRNDKTYTSLSIEQQKSYLKIVQLLRDYGTRNSEEGQVN